MVNPVEILPFETVIRIFSQGLSTADIQRAAATARNWRTISTDEVINQVIDITEFHLGENETIETIHSLASRSSHQGSQIGKEIRLNVDSFWYEMDSTAHLGTIVNGEALQVGRLMEETDFKFICLLSALQLSTHSQLRKLFLKVEKGHFVETQSGFLGKLLVYSADFLNSRGKDFREIRFEVPFPLAFTIGDDFKRFSIESSEINCLEYEIVSTISLLKGAASFTGGRGLTTLEINLRNFIDVDEHSGDEFDRLYQELGKSQDTLSELDVAFNSYASPSKLFTLVSTFSNLSSLTMEFDDITENIEELFIPDLYPDFHLKSLKLTFSEVFVTQFQWLVNIVSSSLQILELTLHYDPEVSNVPATILSSIFEKCPFLNRLSLHRLNIIEQVSSTPSTQVLPSLVSLDLQGVGLSVYEFFSKCSMPILRHFSFNYSFHPYFVLEPEKSQVSEVIFKILKNCSPSLGTIWLGGILESFQSEDQEEQAIIFPQLWILEVVQSNPTALSLLSRCKWPQLKVLDISETSAQAQSILQVLHSSSATLQEVRLRHLASVPSEAQQAYPGERLLFPRLEHLELKIEESETELIDLFSNFDFRKLKVLDVHLKASSDPSRIKTALFPSAILSLIKTNASSLTSLKLCGTSLSFNEEGIEEEEALKFRNLTFLRHSIHCPSLLRCLSLKSQYPRLTELFLNCNGLPNHEILDLLRNCCSSLEKLELMTSQEENKITSSKEVKVKVQFPKLRSLLCYPHNSHLLDDLIGLNRGTLKELEVEEIHQKLKEIAPQLRRSPR